MVSFSQLKDLVIISDYLNWMCTIDIDVLLQDYTAMSYAAQLMNHIGYDIVSHIDQMIIDLEEDHDVSQLKQVQFDLKVCLPVLNSINDYDLKAVNNLHYMEQKLHEAEKREDYLECARIKKRIDALQANKKDK